MIGVIRKARPAHPGDPGIVLEPLGDGRGIGAVPVDTDRQRLQTLQQKEGVEGGKGGPAVAKADRAAPDDVGTVGMVLGVDHSVE